MSMAESKVTGIIKSLHVLEDDLDYLNNTAEDMKKQLSIKAKTGIDKLLEKTQEMATNEAKAIIDAAKTKAATESAKITEEGDVKLSEIQSKINANFDEAVKYVVSTILKT